MRPLDFYRLGARIAETATTEAGYRNAVGRMYYGLHHEACCRYFRENPGAPPLVRGSRHSQLGARFSTLGTEASRGIAYMLRQLSAMRNISDYELGSSITYNNSQVGASQLMTMASIVARELYEALEEYSPGEAPDGCDCRTIQRTVPN
jgi:hypothetical protein